MYDGLYRWNEVDDDLASNPFDQPDIVAFLLTINVTVIEARINFRNDYYTALSYTDSLGEIKYLMSSVLAANRKKYDAIIAAYPFSKYTKRVRSPNITKSINSTSSGSADVTRNQTETREEKPVNYKTEYTHETNPYDNPGLQTSSKDTTEQKGTRSVETKYTGSPDHTATSSSGLRYDTETGTEAITESTLGSGNESIADAMQDLEELKSIWAMFEADIAKKLFLQVWR